MSNSDGKNKVFSTREDRIIKSTLLLYDDNDNKIKWIQSLKSCARNLEALEFDKMIQLDLIETLNHKSNCIKNQMI